MALLSTRDCQLCRLEGPRCRKYFHHSHLGSTYQARPLPFLPPVLHPSLWVKIVPSFSFWQSVASHASFPTLPLHHLSLNHPCQHQTHRQHKYCYSFVSFHGQMIDWVGLETYSRIVVTMMIYEMTMPRRVPERSHHTFLKPYVYGHCH